MSDEDPGEAVDHPADEDTATAAEVDALRDELAALEERIEDRTLHRTDVEQELRSYVRRRQRRGYARGWGPYLVLLYGTVMTLGAFFYLSGGWAILAMLILWLSTLGLYTLMIITGIGLSILGIPGRLRDRLRS